MRRETVPLTSASKEYVKVVTPTKPEKCKHVEGNIFERRETRERERERERESERARG